MNIIRKWYIKNKIKHFFKKEYPVPHTYQAMLMYLNFCQSQEISNIFIELLHKNEIKIATQDFYFDEYIYNPIK